ncbi:endopeptidase La [Candidatus Babela massiliensis]|uniref:Lon protease n=1 Tax=Candidatus Babela massiliensis TaxID=673862 RepID=V6DGN1_9BACT|nr:endopeptidase La [Candidatus Babela massiliensis]CDK30757.1 ATP-dependent Lon protease [Candidatus Babela massiliensis]
MISNDIGNQNIPEILPVVPTMDVVVFPNQIVPLLVLDERIINGINKALEEEPKLILLLASNKQSDVHEGSIGMKDLYKVGTIATIMRLVKIQDGGIKILVQGLSKARVNQILAQDYVLKAKIEPIVFENNCDETEIKAQIKNLKDIANEISSSGGAFSPDFFIILSKMNDPEKIADFILSHLHLSVDQSQKLLEAKSQKDFLESLYKLLIKELELSEVQENIKNTAKDSMNKSQKEFYLREQLRAIKKELGEDDLDEIDRMRDKLSSIELPQEVKSEATRQLNRLEKTSPDSMEAAVIRNHLDWILALPWNNHTNDNLDIHRAKKILDDDHYGLKDIKERILDYISVKHLKKDDNAPILCFAGPPGTGKTSLGKSIAQSLGRNYFRVSLGGVKDEAEIRGHRRTYVGAMPGRFIQGIRKAGSSNPIIIIDELDKIGADFRGDPSAAMLEVLDPQQNKTFYDNYLGVPYDLSKVIFIATANNIETLSEPLKDRMEIITLSGYTLEEKLEIAKRYLVKRSVESTGLDNHDIKFNDEIISDLIENYTREAGVRELERIIKKLCSKAARAIVEENKIISFNLDNIEKYLGPRKFIDSDIYNQNDIGISNGLAWTSYGGELIKVEAVLIPGKGKLILTGSLGNVLKESAQAALSYVKAHSQELGIDCKRFVNYDLHIHVPGGGIPKDGPSAGITLLSSILSALTDRPINAQYAMTGELNLRGNVMPIGGVKEKILAAKRNGVQHVILPERNRNDLIGSEEIANGIDVIWVKHANEVISKVLLEYDKKRISHH